MSAVICDRRVPARAKGKVYKVAVRPAMLYGLETVARTKRQEAELEVAEFKMLRLLLGVTRIDKIRNKYIRGWDGLERKYERQESSIQARHISEGAVPCPHSLAPCPHSLASCQIYIAPARMKI